MARKSKGTVGAAVSESLASISAEAALSFLKDTKGTVSWSDRDLADTLHVSMRDTGSVIAVLEAQGYVQAHGKNWMTTPAGEAVSGAKVPRFTRESVEQAIVALTQRIQQSNKEPNAAFKVKSAVAFGDFLIAERARVQAADIGIELVPKGAHEETRSAAGAREERRFLKELREKSAMLNMRTYCGWMSQRSHRKLR